MIIKDEQTRKQSVRNFCTILERASVRFGELLTDQEELPPISLTTKEYESGEWKAPPIYKEVITRVTAEILTDHYYKLSPAQMRLALLQGAREAGKLIVDGKIVAKPVTTKPRSSALLSRRGPLRKRTSLRTKA